MTRGERGLPSFLLRWHGIGRRAGLEGLRRTLAQIRGVAVPVSDLETAVLPARLHDYSPGCLDRLLSGREVLWQGIQALGRHDGYVAFFPVEQFPLLGRISVFAAGAREQLVREALMESSGTEFDRLAEKLGGFPDDLLGTLWKLVWNGEVSSDSLDALRARRSATAARYRPRARPRYTTRRRILPGAAGRWTLLTGPDTGYAPEGERALGRAAALLDRHGIVGTSTLGDEPSYESLVPRLEELEARGQAQRRDLLGTGEPQFLAPGAREVWDAPEADTGSGVLSACDPANPWGLTTPWPAMTSDYRPRRTPGARVLFMAGELAGYLTGTGHELHTPADQCAANGLIGILKRVAAGGVPVFLERVNGEPPYRTSWHGELVAAGFSPSSRGYLLRGTR